MMNPQQEMSVAMRDIRAVIVDLDGTMVDTLGDFEVALNRTLGALDRPPVNRADIERMVGKGSEHLITSALVHGGLPEEAALAALPRAWDVYQREYLAINGHHSDVYPGVAEGLQAIAAMGLPMACLTNKPRAFALELLEKKGLRAHFSLVFGGDSFEKKKPDPLPLIRTCEALGSATAQTLMIGDSRNDAQAAQGAGCQIWLVPYGYNHGEPISAVEADAHVSDLADAASRLMGVVQGRVV